MIVQKKIVLDSLCCLQSVILRPECLDMVRHCFGLSACPEKARALMPPVWCCPDYIYGLSPGFHWHM